MGPHPTTPVNPPHNSIVPFTPIRNPPTLLQVLVGVSDSPIHTYWHAQADTNSRFKDLIAHSFRKSPLTWSNSKAVNSHAHLGWCLTDSLSVTHSFLRYPSTQHSCIVVSRNRDSSLTKFRSLICDWVGEWDRKHAFKIQFPSSNPRNCPGDPWQLDSNELPVCLQSAPTYFITYFRVQCLQTDHDVMMEKVSESKRRKISRSW